MNTATLRIVEEAAQRSADGHEKLPGRPLIKLPGPNRLLSDFASDMGDALCNTDIFARDGMAFAIRRRGEKNEAECLEPIIAAKLRTWLEQHAVCYRERQSQDQTWIQIKQTMKHEDASGVLVAQQFISKLRPLRRVNHVRMPTRRANGLLELLAEGYDDESATLTLKGGPDIQTDMPRLAAIAVLDDILGEFRFADSGRSKSVAISAALTVFGSGILPPHSLRPCFIYQANAEGAGKTLLVKFATVPVLGDAPTGSYPKSEDEMRKVLISAVMEAQPALVFDNVKVHVGSGELEGFLTAQVYGGRILGGQATFKGENNTNLFITGNGCTVSPDIRRRTLFCEVFQEEERAEDREFKRELEMGEFLARRAEILSALWALIREWDEAGQPKPSRSHSAFPPWARIFGGIVEHAGYACPLDTPSNAAAADTEGADMRELVKAALGESEVKSVTFENLIGTCSVGGMFEELVTDLKSDKARASARSRIASIFRRYDRRLLGGVRFTVVGKSRDRTFTVERVNPAPK